MMLSRIFRHSPFYVLFFTFFTLFPPAISQASWEFLPASYHHLYETYGLWIDQQNMLLSLGPSRIWSALGGCLPLYGETQGTHHPQIITIATANFGLYYTDNLRFYTQNIDARVGFGLDMALDSKNRLTLALLHLSGHHSDAPHLNPATFSPGVGAEIFLIRYLHDWSPWARVGMDYRPYLRSDPPMNTWINAAVYAEVFPWGSQEAQSRGTPYLALGEEYWGTKTTLMPSFHFQLGVYWGSHLEETLPHKTSFRVTLGYYHGADPLLKQSYLLASRSTFFYGGAQFSW